MGDASPEIEGATPVRSDFENSARLKREDLIEKGDKFVDVLNGSEEGITIAKRFFNQGAGLIEKSGATGVELRKAGVGLGVKKDATQSHGEKLPKNGEEKIAQGRGAGPKGTETLFP